MRDTPDTTQSAAPTMAVVVPAHQAAEHIDLCIGGLLKGGFAPKEILVVDDGSSDDTGRRADAHGVGILRNETPLRPARARNRGVEAAQAEIVVFVDADVVVHPGSRDRIARHFGPGTTVDAVFGSYDAAPPAPATVSRYRNLLHHFVHQQSSTEARTFWTGFGAARRARFIELGGLDRRWENIEDVEFGLRLSASGGVIRLDKELLATHLKAWTLGAMFLTDMHGRAKPWTRLLMRGDASVGDLNTGTTHRLSAAAVALGIVSLAAWPATHLAAYGFALAAVTFLGANAAFLRFLARSQGVGFALMAIPFHTIHYVAALSGYALARLENRT